MSSSDRNPRRSYVADRNGGIERQAHSPSNTAGTNQHRHLGNHRYKSNTSDNSSSVSSASNATQRTVSSISTLSIGARARRGLDAESHGFDFKHNDEHFCEVATKVLGHLTADPGREMSNVELFRQMYSLEVRRSFVKAVRFRNKVLQVLSTAHAANERRVDLLTEKCAGLGLGNPDHENVLLRGDTSPQKAYRGSGGRSVSSTAASEFSTPGASITSERDRVPKASLDVIAEDKPNVELNRAASPLRIRHQTQQNSPRRQFKFESTLSSPPRQSHLPFSSAARDYSDPNQEPFSSSRNFTESSNKTTSMSTPGSFTGRPNQAPTSTTPGNVTGRPTQTPSSTISGSFAGQPSHTPYSTTPGNLTGRPTQTPYSTRPGSFTGQPSQTPSSTTPGNFTGRPNQTPSSTTPKNLTGRPNTAQRNFGDTTSMDPSVFTFSDDTFYGTDPKSAPMSPYRSYGSPPTLGLERSPPRTGTWFHGSMADPGMYGRSPKSDLPDRSRKFDTMDTEVMHALADDVESNEVDDGEDVTEKSTNDEHVFVSVASAGGGSGDEVFTADAQASSSDGSAGKLGKTQPRRRGMQRDDGSGLSPPQSISFDKKPNRNNNRNDDDIFVSVETTAVRGVSTETEVGQQRSASSAKNTTSSSPRTERNENTDLPVAPKVRSSSSEMTPKRSQKKSDKSTSDAQEPKKIPLLEAVDLPKAKVVAPANLPEGYSFEARVGNRRFMATVPPGGVSKGETFFTYTRELDKMEVSVPVGEWRDDICDCCSFGPCHPLFLNTCFCPHFALAQIMTRSGLDYKGHETLPFMSRQTCVTVVIIVCTCVILNTMILSLMLYDYKTYGDFPPSWQKLATWASLNVVFILYTYYAIYKTRVSLRSRYMIPERRCKRYEDCCCAVFCSFCTITQMGRHTGDFGTFRAICCNSTGLPRHVSVPRNPDAACYERVCDDVDVSNMVVV